MHGVTIHTHWCCDNLYDEHFSRRRTASVPAVVGSAVGRVGSSKRSSEGSKSRVDCAQCCGLGVLRGPSGSVLVASFSSLALHNTLAMWHLCNVMLVCGQKAVNPPAQT